jgi:5-(carboxyamino)imidazole ribonucleotide mutase
MHASPSSAHLSLVPQDPAAKVGVVMGSQSDWSTMQGASELLTQLGIPHHCEVVSAHRTPDKLADYAKHAKANGLQVIIAGAGGAAHLPGMLAAYTDLPVLGVPVQSKALNGLDSLLSIVQMPAGIPVATLAIGQAGAKNAAILAASILALHNEAIAHSLSAFRAQQTQAVLDNPFPH